MSGSRNIKDSLFVALFNNEAAARELYNAIYATHYGLETPIRMTTLDDVLYRGIKNDVSFTVGGDIYLALFEQQSSFSYNIPLRILLYISHGYERLIPNKETHKDKLLKIPRPCPVVLYTGRDSGKKLMKQARVILHLSDAFKGEAHPFGFLELEVLVLNIMPGYNKRILRRAPRLRGYMDFVTRLREQERSMPRVEAILATVDWCIANDILADFFREHRKEVSNMILNELNNADAIEAAKEETWEKASKIVREETWKEASKIVREETWKEASKIVREETWKEAREETWKEASKIVREETSKATWEEAQQQVFDLIDQGLTGEQLKQALRRECLRMTPQTAKRKSAKR